MMPYNMRFWSFVEVYAGPVVAVVMDGFFVVGRLIVLGEHFVVGGGVSGTW